MACATEYAHDSDGKRLMRLMPNGVTTGYGYDPLGRLIHMETSDGSGVNSGFAYTLNAAGQCRVGGDAGGRNFGGFRAEAANQLCKKEK